MAGFSSAGRQQVGLPLDGSGILAGVAAQLKSRGHVPLRQGYSFECAGCGRTCTVALRGGEPEINGTLYTRACNEEGA